MRNLSFSGTLIVAPETLHAHFHAARNACLMKIINYIYIILNAFKTNFYDEHYIIVVENHYNL